MKQTLGLPGLLHPPPSLKIPHLPHQPLLPRPSSTHTHTHTHTPSWQFHFKQRPIGWAGETPTWGCQGTKLVNLLAFVCCKACVAGWRWGLLGRVGDEGYIWQGGEGETRGLRAPARPKVSKGTRRTGLRAMASGQSSSTHILGLCTFLG